MRHPYLSTVPSLRFATPINATSLPSTHVSTTARHAAERGTFTAESTVSLAATCPWQVSSFWSFRGTPPSTSAAVNCHSNGRYLFRELTTEFARLYYRGGVSRFFPHIAPEARRSLVQALTPLVGAEQARRWEYALVLSEVFPDEDRMALFAKIDASDQRGVVERMLREAEGLVWNEAGSALNLDPHSSNRKLPNFRKGLEYLKLSCRRILQRPELNYAELSFLTQLYLNFVGTVNQYGETRYAQSRFSVPQDPDEMPKITSYDLAFPIGMMGNGELHNLLFPSFENIHCDNFADAFRGWAAGLLVVALTPARYKVPDYDGQEMSHQTPGSDFTGHDFVHVDLRRVEERNILNMPLDPHQFGYAFPPLYPPSLIAALSSHYRFEKRLRLLAWYAEKRVAFERRLQERPSRFQRLAQVAWCLLDRENALMSEDSIKIYSGVSLTLQRLIGEGRPWQKAESPGDDWISQEAYGAFQSHFRSRLLNVRNDLWELLRPIPAREISNEEWLEVFDFLGEVLELPYGKSLNMKSPWSR